MMLHNASYDIKVKTFVVRLMNTLGAPEEELCSVLQCSPPQFRKFLEGARSLNILEFSRLAEAYRFSLDAFDQDRVDLEALRDQRSGYGDVLPSRYTVGAFSRIRLIRTIHKYVKESYGCTLADDLLVYFNITEKAWNNPNRPISVYFMEDALSYLRSRGLNSWDFLRIGRQAVSQSSDSELPVALSECWSPAEMYERYLGHEIKFVETNNEYVITEMTDSRCVLESRENSDVLDVFKTNHVAGIERCIYRVGALSQATHYLRLPEAHVIEPKCVHRGDPVCEYVVDFSLTAQVDRHERGYG